MKNINITKIHILETRGEIILDNIEIYEKLENKMKNSEIKTNIMQAVEAATGLETHKIQVFEMVGN